VLSPTRELASQIAEGFDSYGAGLGLRCVVIFGGVAQNPQVNKLRAGIDILVATPGRLLDLMGQGFVDLRDIEVFVLDEADRMLDMGFIRDVERVMERLPQEKQTLLFSATMPDDIERLARKFLHDPVRVEVTPPATTVEKIEQRMFHVDKADKRELLLHLFADPLVSRAIVFSRTKHGANRISEVLERAGVAAAAIHGNKSQGARERALAGFKSGRVRALVATDIAARGIDVDDVSHVIQVDLPEVPEQYVHRIGRTARAGASGVAWAFCAIDEQPLLRDIERTIRMEIDVVHDHPWALRAPSRGSASAAAGTASGLAAGAALGDRREPAKRPDANRNGRSRRRRGRPSSFDGGNRGPARVHGAGQAAVPQGGQSPGGPHRRG
jgi:ATP-dependent RNA helicase RhlE